MPLRAPNASADDPAARTCNLHYIRRELGQSNYSDKRMAQYLAQLVDRYQFPAPLPSIRKGGKVSAAVHADSKWLRAAVDAWIDGTGTPPPVAAAIERRAHAEAAEAMDAAALNLRMVGGRDYRGAEA
jgi:hypothetical protein